MKPSISILNLASSSRAHALFVGAIAVLLANQSTRAASGTWTNTTSGDLWSVSGNWNLGIIADGLGSTADFSTLDIDANNTVSLDTARTIGNLAFGDAITPSNNWILDNGGVPENILTLASTAKPVITITNQSASLNLVLSGGNGFTKAGPGELILNGANTLSGIVRITEGTLSIGSDAITSATAGLGSIVMSNGTTFRLNTTSAGIFIANPIVTSGANANATITSGQLSSAYTGNIFGSSDQTLTIGSGNVSFNGTTQQLAGFSGTLSVPAGNLLRYSTTNTGAQVGGSNTSFDVNGTILARNGLGGIHLGALSGTGALNGGGSTNVGTNNWIVGGKSTDSAFQGTINNGTGDNASTSALTKTGTGTLILNGAVEHTYTGATSVNGGTLLLDFANLATPSSLLNISSNLGLGGGTFRIKGQATGMTEQSFAGTNVNAGASSIVLNPNNGAGTELNLAAITRAQGGTVNFTPVALGTVNTFTPNVFIAGGQQTILGGYATVNRNTWAVSGTADVAGVISGLATADYANTGVMDLSAAASLDVDVAAAGTNTTGGAMTVNSLRFNDSTAPATVDATGGTLTVATGGILVTSNVGANPITISGGSLTSGANPGPDLIVIQDNTAAPLTISSVISGSPRGFTKSGAGTLIITGTNTITGGGTHVNEGTLQLGDGTATTVINGSGNSMNLNGGTLALNIPNGTNYTNSIVNISGTSGIRNATTGDVRVVAAYASVITKGPVTLNLSSAGGQLTHQGTESGFTGTIAMIGETGFNYRFNSGGTNNNLGSANALYDLGTNANNLISRNGGGATINLGGLQGGSATTLRGAQTSATNNAMTYSIGALNTSTVFNGVIMNGTAAENAVVNVTKVGIASLTLTNANTYTGATNVNAGTLNITGSITSAVTVNNNGTLSGTGSITGNVQVNSGGRIASAIAATAGAQVPLAITGSLTLNSGSILDLTAAVAPADGTYTLATTTEGVTYTEGAVNLAGVAGTVSVSGNNLILTVGAGGSGYADWAAANVGGAAANVDSDNDGVQNGVEYFMNAPAGFTANPSLADGTVTWINGGNIPSSAYGTQFVVQISSDLVVWTNVPLADVDNTSGSVSYTPTGPDKSFARLAVNPN